MTPEERRLCLLASLLLPLRDASIPVKKREVCVYVVLVHVMLFLSRVFCPHITPYNVPTINAYIDYACSATQPPFLWIPLYLLDPI